MSEKSDATPDMTAPSPADGPTLEAPAVRRDADGPVEHDTDRMPGGTSGGIAGGDTVPTSGASARPTRTSVTGRKAQQEKTEKPGPGLTRIGGTWIGLILGAIILIFLLIFILQNLNTVPVYFLGLQAELPLGIWMLFSAIAGLLLVAIPGLGRLVQWRRSTRPPKR